ncbi:MAG: phenylacetate--CoA ligase family protein, partial [Candidatus Competibacteraceae bacterium]|nr:phenylacetate--CoA ligase family protein [Candidatus Competibacteraceae bacterium]
MTLNWKMTSYLWDLWTTPRMGQAAIATRAGKRLADLLTFARSRSPFYQRLYRHLPPNCFELAALPPVNKGQLMANFDDWVTDPRISRAELDGFLADHSLIGHLFRDRYAVFTSSGTTGQPGIYLHDDQAQSVYEALLAGRFDPQGLGSRALARIGRRGFAMIAATGGHFAGTATWERWRRLNPTVAARVFSVALPVEELVDRLNDFQPAFLASYPSTIAL